MSHKNFLIQYVTSNNYNSINYENKFLILVSFVNNRLVIGPKISKYFCKECFIEKIAIKSNFYKSFSVDKNFIYSKWNTLKPLELCTIDENNSSLIRFLLPAVKEHSCSILKSNILRKYSLNRAYGLLKEYKKNYCNGLHIIKGVIDVNNVSETFLTVCGKDRDEKKAVRKFLGEASERYFSQLYKPNKELIISKGKIIFQKTNERFDWNSKNTFYSTVGLASYTNFITSLKKSFYEVVERNYLYKFARNEVKILKTTTLTKNNQLSIENFFIENEFSLPIIISLANQTINNSIFYGIGISASSKLREAKQNAENEALQILYEKQLINQNDNSLSVYYKKIFSNKDNINTLHSSFFLKDFFKA